MTTNVVEFKSGKDVKDEKESEEREKYKESIKTNLNDIMELANQGKIRSYTMVVVTDDDTLMTEAMYDDSFFILLGALNAFTSSMNVVESAMYMNGSGNIG